MFSSRARMSRRSTARRARSAGVSGTLAFALTAAAGGIMFVTATQAAALTATAPDNCAMTGPVATCSYTAAGQYALPLPSGVTTAEVDAFGAAGGVDYWDHTGSGAGGAASGTIDVSTTASLWVLVGGVGGGPDDNGPPGGYNGGGPGGDFGGGGGGGASDVRTSDGTLDSRVLVAAGGGGAGGAAATPSVAAGGSADAAGAGTGRAGGGGPGTQSAGGDGGTSNNGEPGNPGGAGNGGANVIYGGGGGGGYFGGGAGGGGDDGRGGGGGGGSSFVPLGGTTGVAVNTPASVTVTFTATAPDAPTGATATAGIGQADVSWTDSAYDWGFPITGYTVTATDSTDALNGGQTCTGASTTCTVTGLTPGDSYTFTVVANSTPDSVSSDPSNAVNPTSKPVVTSSPTSQEGPVGSSASFGAAASGYPTPDVQWQISTDGGASFTDIAGETTTAYATSTLTSADDGNQYRAVFTNSAGTATTTVATLTVDYAPVITTSPASQSVAAGSTATLTAAASGEPAPSVHWQRSTDGGGTFTNILGATATSYTTPTLTCGRRRQPVPGRLHQLGGQHADVSGDDHGHRRAGRDDRPGVAARGGRRYGHVQRGCER